MPWQVRLAADAETDIADIAAWTTDQFGPRQADAYIAVLLNGIRPLGDGPDGIGTHPIAGAPAELRLLRIPRARHVMAFQIDHDTRRITILRILHASMDTARHLPPEA